MIGSSSIARVTLSLHMLHRGVEMLKKFFSGLRNHKHIYFLYFKLEKHESKDIP